MRLLVVLVVTVALLAAAAPLAITQAPRLDSPVLALVAFAVAGIALLAGLVLLARAALLLRRSRSLPDDGSGPVPSAGGWPVQDDQPPADESVTEPRPGPDRIVLVPTAGRLAVAVPMTVHPPRHARDDAPDPVRDESSHDLGDDAVTDQASDQEPVTVGQSDGGGESQSQAQASSAFAARYTTTRSRR